MWSRRTRSWHWLPVVVLAASCSRPTPSATPLVAAAPAVEKPAPTPEPTSVDDETRRFAERWTRGLRAGDAAALATLLSTEALLERALDGLEIDDAFAAGMRSSGLDGADITRRWVGHLSGANIALVRVTQHDGHATALCRHVWPEGGVNYTEWWIRRGADGALAVVDLYSTSNGELASTSMRRALAPIVRDQSRSFLARLLSPKSDTANHAAALAELALATSDDPARAVAIYDGLPGSVRAERHVAMSLVNARRALWEARDTEETYADYLAAIEAFLRIFPDDPAVALLGYDLWYEKRDDRRALGAIDALERRIGREAYLELLRAFVHLQKRRFTEARVHAREARKLDESLEDVHWTLLSIEVGSRDYAYAVRHARTLRDEFDQMVGPNETTGTADDQYDYAAFFESPEYAKFVAEMGETEREDDGDERD